MDGEEEREREEDRMIAMDHANMDVEDLAMMLQAAEAHDKSVTTEEREDEMHCSFEKNVKEYMAKTFPDTLNVDLLTYVENASVCEMRKVCKGWKMMKTFDDALRIKADSDAMAEEVDYYMKNGIS